MSVESTMTRRLSRLLGLAPQRTAPPSRSVSRAPPVDRDAERHGQRLERLERLCAAANTGLCGDVGAMIVAVEALERDRLYEMRER